jgi:hypothetical protein
MTVTAASFKAAFPAFTSDTDYPIPMLTYQLSLAVKLHNADRWGELLDDGIMLWTAHMITLEQQSSAAAAAGQSAGAIAGPHGLGVRGRPLLQPRQRIGRCSKARGTGT